MDDALDELMERFDHEGLPYKEEKGMDREVERKKGSGD